MKTIEEMFEKHAFKSDARNWERDVIRVCDAEYLCEEYSAQQLAEFKEKLKKGISNMYIGTTLQQHVPVAKFIELIETL